MPIPPVNRVLLLPLRLVQIEDLGDANQVFVLVVVDQNRILAEAHQFQVFFMYESYLLRRNFKANVQFDRAEFQLVSVDLLLRLLLVED